MKLYEKAGFIFGLTGIFVLSVIAVTVTHFKGNAQILNTASLRPPSISPAPGSANKSGVKSAQAPVVYVHSSDGTKQVIMRTKVQADNSVLYTFSTGDVPGPGSTGAIAWGNVFFTRSIGGNGSMKVPPNTWSPDNKYFYLEEDEAGFTDIYVFKADGSLFNNNQQYLSVSSLFAKKQLNYVFNNVTGWDSDTLMHILTTTDGKNPGPKYWFDVPSTSFIQLAS